MPDCDRRSLDSLPARFARRPAVGNAAVQTLSAQSDKRLPNSNLLFVQRGRRFAIGTEVLHPAGAGGDQTLARPPQAPRD